MPFLEVNGVRCFYHQVVNGGGLPLIFIHGSGGSHSHWHFQLKGLSGAAMLLAPDLPGHGRSAGKPAESVGIYREWIYSFASSLGLTRFVLAGHSLGGAIAMDYALHYTESLAGLILVGTGARLRVAPAILESLRRGLPPASMTELAYGSLATPELLQQAALEMASVDTAVFLADFTACDHFDIMEQIPRITQPCLIICGTEDRLTPLKYSRYLMQQLPRGELVEISGAGHMVMLEAPEELNSAVARFLDKLS
mgnify:CR=1 FL=1